MTNALTASGVFGSLLSDPEIASEFGATAFIARMLEFEAAWTQALADCGVVTEQEANGALAAISAFSGASLGLGSDRDGVPVPALVAALKSGLDAGAARAVHTGTTSQDVVDTALILTCLSVLDRLSDRLGRVVAGLDAMLTSTGDAPLMARTRMQAALPATVSLRLDAWRRPLADRLAQVASLRAELAVVQIGGPIGLRDAPHPHLVECAGKTADMLGLSLGPVWHADRSRIMALGHWLSLVAGSLGKVGQDVALMAQQGIDEIALTGGGGSSAMAHKQNPVSAEMLVALARFVAGQQGILAQAMIHEQERSGAAWAMEWLTLPSMAEATGAALSHAERLIASIERIGTPD